METMSLRIGINYYICYNNPIQGKSKVCKDIVSTEINHFKNFDEGEKK